MGRAAGVDAKGGDGQQWRGGKQCGEGGWGQ